MNKEEILAPQDWGFPVPIAYGPGRIKEIGKSCESLNIKKPLIVTDRGSKDLTFISNLVQFLEKCCYHNCVCYIFLCGKNVEFCRWQICALHKQRR